MDAGLPEELTSALTPPTADQLIHEGDGVYVIADEYFLSYIDLFVDLSAEQAGVSGLSRPQRSCPLPARQRRRAMPPDGV